MLSTKWVEYKVSIPSYTLIGKLEGGEHMKLITMNSQDSKSDIPLPKSANA